MELGRLTPVESRGTRVLLFTVTDLDDLEDSLIRGLQTFNPKVLRARASLNPRKRESHSPTGTLNGAAGMA